MLLCGCGCGCFQPTNHPIHRYTLKNMMFNLWQRDGCEERVDTLKSLSLIDMFVPFFPLDRPAILEIARKSVETRVGMVNRARAAAGRPPVVVALPPPEDVLAFLADKIEWDGQYAVEGGKEVATVIRRHIFGLLYRLAEDGGEEEKEDGAPGEAERGERAGCGPAEYAFELDGATRRVKLARTGSAEPCKSEL